MAASLPISSDELKDILFKLKIVKEADWEDASRNAYRRRRGVHEVLIERGLFNTGYLYELISSYLKVPYVNLRRTKIDVKVLELLSEKIASKAKAIPFALDNGEVKIAFIDPRDKKAVELVKKSILGKKISVFLTSNKNYLFAIRLYEKSIKKELSDILNKKIVKEEGKPVKIDIPVIKIIDSILEYGIFDQASDIHIEPLSDAVVIRFRIDGELHDKAELPSSVHDAILARIKILSNLRIDEHRVPQDGRFSFNIEDEEESVRVSIIPAFYGEKVVMRLMTDEAQNFTLEDIGLSEKNIEIMKRQIDKPFGMILVVGPTGSGKTTTLYTVLNLLNTESVNICTIEDPIEYGVHRINQTQVNTKTGYTFATGLRSLLRQDPDIIMIGEIRDKETAQIAVRAGLTGHLVLSTLHTNNAAGAPPRLLDMEVESFLVASTLNVVIAQRLVRRICADCIESFHLSEQELVSLSKELDLEKMLQRFKDLGVVEKSIKSFRDLTFYKGKGCPNCSNSGYKKRVAIMEVLENTEAIQNLIIRNASSGEINKAAMDGGMVNIFEDGMQKVLLGVTTIEEVLRIKQE
jgi:type IV pilus assembly protein PilB